MKEESNTVVLRRLTRLGVASFLALSLNAAALGQNENPLGYSIATPRPINPAEGTTTPSAQAAQQQNPYLGSVPGKNTGHRIELTLKLALERGLQYNLGLVESTQSSADVHAERLRSLSALLPQLSADARSIAAFKSESFGGVQFTSITKGDYT